MNYNRQDRPLKLQCRNCDGQLRILGKIGYNLHTKCMVCGADSGAQIQAEYERKASGVQRIPVLRKRLKKYG